MVRSEAAYLVLLALVTCERLNELRVSRSHAKKAFARGGIEAGREHYGIMSGMHTAFLVACAAEVVFLHRPFPGVLGWISLGAVVSAQALRAWAMNTLGDRWNTRIIVTPDAPPVTRGPYRFIRHPNYVAVIIEIAFLPLVHGAWLTAVLFSVANAAMLFVRIRAEEQALGTSWQDAFGNRPRFIPGGGRG